MDVEALTSLKDNIGIHLDITNGKPRPLTLSADRRGYFIEQLRLQVLVLDFPATDVFQWLQSHSEFSGLDWEGLHQVKTSWEPESGPPPPTYEETRGLHGALWMTRPDHRITIAALDGDNKTIGDPIELTPDAFVMDRRTGLSWSTGQPAMGHNGSNAGDYSQVEISSGGNYAGEQDDIYKVAVIEGGALDGTARVAISSVLGDDRPVVAPGPPPAAANFLPVVSGEPIALGERGLGATITFTETAVDQHLVEGDNWIVRVGPVPHDAPPGSSTVGKATPGTQAIHGAMAEIRWMIAELDAPVLQLSQETEQLGVQWSIDEQTYKTYTIPVSFKQSTLDYGLQIDLAVSDPANGDYYESGEKFTVKVDLLDGAGNRLHPEKRLPTYAEYRAGEANGILYFDSPPIPSANGFFNEAKINIMTMSVFGPKHLVGLNYSEHEPTEYYYFEHAFPNTSEVAVGGLRDPKLWETVIPNEVDVTLPKDVEGGTYVVVVKAQRSHLGATTFRMAEVDIQVRGWRRTDYVGGVGNCAVCHTRGADLDRMRHGNNNDRLCVACHPREHGLVAEHVHTIHFLSPKFFPPRNDCTLCHIQPESNSRASVAICGSCHGAIHDGEPFIQDSLDPYIACGSSCHPGQQTGHIQLPPL